MKNFLLVLSVAAVLFSGCKKEEAKETEHLPTACFTWQVIDTTIAFTNCSVGGLAYTWNFGDGRTSDEFSPSHGYSPGTYTATLNVTNADGTSSKTAGFTIAYASPRFVGRYHVADSCNYGNTTYDIVITADGPNQVIISNFAQSGYYVYGLVSGSSLIIPSQSPTLGLIFVGSGTLSDDSTTLNFNYRAPTGIADCISVGTKY